MRNFFENLSYKMQGWMQGRHGMDELSRKMMIAALICLILSAVSGISIFYTLAVVLIIWSYFRCFSKNSYSRNKELDAYYKFHNKVMDKIKLRKRMWKERKEYKYFKCNQCKSWSRVPKGKGSIEITCRVCHSKMKRKS